MILVLIWIQWSWKWTQARILEDKFWFKLYEAGWTLRKISKENSELWRLVKNTIESWKHVSPEIIEDILKDLVEKNKWSKLILDWFVRNKWNKDSMDKIVWDYRVVFLDLPEIEAKKRLIWRMYDKETWETFPAWVFVNPKNGNTLMKRSDDEESAIEERIRLFFEKTMPIVEEYKKEWKLIEVDANKSIDEVTNELILKLWL